MNPRSRKDGTHKARVEIPEKAPPITDQRLHEEVDSIAHASQAHSIDRVNLIVKMIVRGHQTASIVQYCTETWKITGRMVHNYIKKAMGRIADVSQTNIKAEFGKAVMRYEFLYSRAVSNDDDRLAAAIVDKMVELYGLKTIKIDFKEHIIFETKIGNDGVLMSTEVDEVSPAKERLKASSFLDAIDHAIKKTEEMAKENAIKKVNALPPEAFSDSTTAPQHHDILKNSVEIDLKNV